MANIYDVAKLSGVSKSTVSKVLTNTPGVSDRTKELVLGAMEQLGYQPNFHARSLAGKNLKVIALVIARDVGYVFKTTFFSEVICGISDVLSKNGYYMLLSIGNNGRPEQSVDGLLDITYADGYIILDVRKGDDVIETIQKIRPKKEFIVIGSYPEDETVSFIDLDQIEATKIVVKHFFNLGHRNIAMISGPLNSQSSLDRVSGFRQAYREFISKNQDPVILHGEYSSADGYEKTKEILSQYPETTAIFAASDLFAVGCYRYLHEKNISIPDEISIVGFDDSEIAAQLSPPLTTIHLGAYQNGCTAAQKLISMIEDKKSKTTERILVEPILVLRDSTGKCRSL